VVSGRTDSAGEVAIGHTFTSGKVTMVVTGFNLATIRTELKVEPPIRIDEVVLQGRATDADDILYLEADAAFQQVPGNGVWTLTLPVQDDALDVGITVSDTSGNTAGCHWLLRPMP
jgi:hypothetical protein